MFHASDDANVIGVFSVWCVFIVAFCSAFIHAIFPNAPDFHGIDGTPFCLEIVFSRATEFSCLLIRYSELLLQFRGDGEWSHIVILDKMHFGNIGLSNGIVQGLA